MDFSTKAPPLNAFVLEYHVKNKKKKKEKTVHANTWWENYLITVSPIMP